MLSFSNTGWTSPNSRKDPDVEVSEVVEAAAQRAETELAGQPEILAELQRTIGNVYFGQGRFDRAEKLLRAALKTQIKLYGPQHREVARTSSGLASTLIRMGNNAESEAVYRQALNIYRKGAKNGHADMVTFVCTLARLSAVLGRKGDAPAAEACYLQALQSPPPLF